MASKCHHLNKPHPTAMHRLMDPTRWACDTCHSTDGVWVCLQCGHAGCSREASLGPAYGGGHALHHHLTHASCRGACVLDVVTRHAHCYLCDDYIIEDPRWLRTLRDKIAGLVPTPPPEEPSSDSPDLKPCAPGHVGLVNLGNTCFINASMQLLASLGSFRSFFRDFLKAQEEGFHVGQVGLARQATMVWQTEVEAKVKPKALELVHAVHGLLRVLRAGTRRAVRPHLLVQAVWTHATHMFPPYVQCCAAEFVTYALDRLTHELGEEAGRIIHALFTCEVEYSTTCSHCGTVSTRRECNHDLALALPELVASDGDGAGSPDDVSLPALLARLFQVEHIPDYFCEGFGCRCMRPSTRTARLVAHPPVLLLTIKRTRYSPQARRAIKDARPVAFPVELPLSILPLAATGRAPAGRPSGGSLAPSYRLAAAIMHSSARDRQTGHASAMSGHYYCFTREGTGDAAANGSSSGDAEGDRGGGNGSGNAGGLWLEKNDAKVRVATEAEVLRHERACFVLAYEMQGGGGMPDAMPPRSTTCEEPDKSEPELRMPRRSSKRQKQ